MRSSPARSFLRVTTPVSPRAPRRVGPYEVLTPLGSGETATAYLARRVERSGAVRRVVLRVLHPHLLHEEAVVHGFIAEARHASALRHPNVVKVRDLAREGRAIYTVSDYVEGDTLASLCAPGAAVMPVGVALRVALDVLAALHAMHELRDAQGAARSLVHRGFTARSVLVGVDGVSRLCDLGLARVDGRTGVTSRAVMLRRWQSMSPEVLEGAGCDRRADVFSAAAVLWESLTQTSAFPWRASFEEARERAHDPARALREVAPDAPESLDEVLDCALSVDATDRFPSTRAFAGALVASVGDLVASHAEVGAFVAAIARAKIARERDASRASLAVVPSRALPHDDEGPELELIDEPDDEPAPRRATALRAPTQPSAWWSRLRARTLPGIGAPRPEVEVEALDEVDEVIPYEHEPVAAIAPRPAGPAWRPLQPARAEVHGRVWLALWAAATLAIVVAWLRALKG